MTPGKTVSLVLGGGGARGYAHIGVIRWLQSHGYEIRSVSGCSMGALIGGVYAAGKLDECTEWALALRRRDIVRLIDPSFFSEGLLKGDRVINSLRDLIGDLRIEDLPLRFTAVATDLEREEECWLDSGPLFDAIRASIAVPTVFTPTIRDGNRLLDGGLVNPLPLEPAMEDDTDLTVAVELFGRPDDTLRPHPEPDEDPDEATEDQRRRSIREFIGELQERFKPAAGEKLMKGPFDLVPRSIEAMQSAITGLKVAASPPEILIPVPRNAGSFWDFHRAGELIALGEELADRAMREHSANGP